MKYLVFKHQKATKVRSCQANSRCVDYNLTIFNDRLSFHSQCVISVNSAHGIDTNIKQLAILHIILLIGWHKLVYFNNKPLKIFYPFQRLKVSKGISVAITYYWKHNHYLATNKVLTAKSRMHGALYAALSRCLKRSLKFHI